MGKDGGARLPVLKTYKLFVGGAFPRSESGRYLTHSDAKGKFVANYARASRKDFRDAVVKARKALGGWSKRTAFNRGQILYRMAEMLESRAGSLEAMLTEHAGFDAKTAARGVSMSVDRLVYYAGWCDKFPTVFGSTNPIGAPFFNFTFPEPTGVVASLAPQGSPLLGLVTAFAPLIAGGNTVVMVVDNVAPAVAAELGEVLQNSDLPGGVVNFLTGLRSELRKHVGSHMDVDGLQVFGGDAEERKELQLLAAESVKRVKLYDEPKGAEWAEQSPYAILPFVEFKTAWHPMGV